MQREKNVREQLGSAPFQEDDGNGMMGMTSLAESDEESGDDELTRSLNHTWLNYRS